MAGEVLHQYYVDFISRGLEDVGRRTREMSVGSEKAAASYRKLRDEIRDAGRAANSVNPVRPFERGGGGFNNIRANTPAARPTGGIQLAQPARAAGTGGAGLEAAGLAKMGASAAVAGAAIGALTGYLTALAAATKQGFEGTVELDQFGRAMQQFTRELANVAAPALEFVTRVVNGFVGQIREMGELGQKVVGRGIFGPVGYLFEVLGDPSIQGAISQVGAAFGQLVAAMRPLMTISVNLGTALLKAFVVKPLVEFADKLTFALLVLEKVARAVGQFATSALRLVGLGSLTRPLDGPRREVRLNQTGSEDATGTYQRIQEAVYRATAGVKDEDPQLTKLTELYDRVDGFFKVVEAQMNQVKADARNVADAVGAVSPVARLGTEAGQLFGNWLRSRR